MEIIISNDLKNYERSLKLENFDDSLWEEWVEKMEIWVEENLKTNGVYDFNA